MKRFKKLLAILCAVGCMSSYSAMTVLADNEQEQAHEPETQTVVDSVDSKQPLYNDPMFGEQYYFYDSNILPIHERRVSNSRVKIAVYDWCFGQLGYDVSWSDYMPEKGVPLFPDTTSYHGANLCSIIGMIPDDGIAGVGIANNVEIVPFHVNPGMEDYPGYTTSEMLRECMDNDILIVVSSCGVVCDEETLLEFASKGGIFINSAGNGAIELNYYFGDKHVNGPEFPSYSYENGHLVQKTQNLDAMLLTQNADNLVRLYSNKPGHNIMVATGVKCNGDFDNLCYGAERVTIGCPVYSTMYDPMGYGVFSATSFASPVLGGIVTLLQSYFPSASTSQIRQAIVNSAFPNKSLNGKCQANGTVNAYGAMLELERMVLADKYKVDPAQVITDGEYYIQNAKTGNFLSFGDVKSDDSRASVTKDCGDAQKFKIEVTKNLEYVIMPVDDKDNCLYYNEEHLHAYIGDFGETGNHAWEIEYAGMDGDDALYHLNSCKDEEATYSLYETSNLLNAINKGSGTYKSMNKDWVLIPASDYKGVDPVYFPSYPSTKDLPDSSMPILKQGEKASLFDPNKSYYIQNVATGEFVNVHRYDSKSIQVYDRETDLSPITKMTSDYYRFKFTPTGNYTFIESARYDEFDSVLGIGFSKTDYKTSIYQHAAQNNSDNNIRWTIVQNADGTYSFRSKMWNSSYLAYNDFYDTAPRMITKLCALRVGDEIPDEAKWRIYSESDAEFIEIMKNAPAMPPLPHTLKPSDQKDINPVTPVPVPTTTPAPAAAPAPTTPTKEPAPTPVPTPSFDLPLEEGTYYITNSSDGTRLSCELGSQDVRLWDPDDYFVQQWQVTLNSNGNYVIKPVGTNWVLNYRARFRNGDIVDCTNPTAGAKGQEFVIVPRGDGTFEIQVSFNANFTMVYDGLDVMFLDCTGQTNPMNSWIFTKVN